ncbi:SAM-dependent methyltransferase [filamentous cyanobacterium CCP5]|nr:SAM-dependent methyltransferase [filamentous cyanobacterium CCP5]
MPFSLDQVVPWGRSFQEYLQMFNLTAVELGSSILGCGDGPAAFNSELSRRGGQIVSVDPLYRFSRAEIAQRIQVTSAEVLEQTRQHQQDFVWQAIASPTMLEEVRMGAMAEFLADFEAGLAEGRYLDASLPELPFENGQFDLALCSHLLFLYGAQFDGNFHLAAIGEMLRVASEVRIFPVLELGNLPSRHLERVMAVLKDQRRQVYLETVGYEFQKGGNQMLVIR